VGVEGELVVEQLGDALEHAARLVDDLGPMPSPGNRTM
jgi:hypothetical protein